LPRPRLRRAGCSAAAAPRLTRLRPVGNAAGGLACGPATPPVPEAAPADDPLDLTLDLGAEGVEEAYDAAPVQAPPPRPRVGLGAGEPERPAPRVSTGGGSTLFERMANLSRGVARTETPRTARMGIAQHPALPGSPEQPVIRHRADSRTNRPPLFKEEGRLVGLQPRCVMGAHDDASTPPIACFYGARFYLASVRG
jgi:hypothetical protein